MNRKPEQTSPSPSPETGQQPGAWYRPEPVYHSLSPNARRSSLYTNWIERYFGWMDRDDDRP